MKFLQSLIRGKLSVSHLVQEDVPLDTKSAHFARVFLFAPASHPWGRTPVVGGGALPAAAPHSLVLQLGLQLLHLVPQSAALALDHVQQVPQLVHRGVRVHRFHRWTAVVLLGFSAE